MEIKWRLRMAAAQREVWTGAQLRRLLADRAGLELSSASVSALFSGQPAQVKLSTLAALCTALQCTPDDLFEVDTAPAERPAAPPSAPAPAPKAASGGRSMPPIDRTPWDEAAEGLRQVRGSGWHHRPRLLLPVLAPPASGGSQELVPGLRPGPRAAGRDGPVQDMLAGVRRLRRPGPAAGPGPVHALSSPARA